MGINGLALLFLVVPIISRLNIRYQGRRWLYTSASWTICSRCPKSRRLIRVLLCDGKKDVLHVPCCHFFQSIPVLFGYLQCDGEVWDVHRCHYIQSTPFLLGYIQWDGYGVNAPKFHRIQSRKCLLGYIQWDNKWLECSPVLYHSIGTFPPGKLS